MPPRRIRVLHAVLDLDAGGLERLVADLIRRGNSTRFEFHVLALNFLGRMAEGLESYAQLHVAPKMGKASMLWPQALIRELRALAPDVIHSHSGAWYKVALAASHADRPFLIHTDHGRHHPDPWQNRLVDGLASRRTDVIVAVSEKLAEQLRRTVVAYPERVRYIRNGVDTDRFAPHPDNGVLRNELGLAPDAPIIGSIGRLEYIKGYDIMIEAFAMMARNWEGPSRPALVIAGDGTEQDRLAARVREIGLEGRAFLLGFRQDLEQLYRAFTLFTMSSRSEGTSVSLLEAMSAGLCPVVSDVGGNRVVLGPALTSRLVPPMNPPALVAAWTRALVRPNELATDGAAARCRVELEYSLERMVQAYETLYADGAGYVRSK